MTDDLSPRLRDAATLLREVLDRHDYDDEQIAARGLEPLGAAAVRVRPLSEYQCRADAPLDILLRIYLLGMKVSWAAGRRVFSEAELNLLRDAGLLRGADSGELDSIFAIQPWAGKRFLSDFMLRKEPAVEPVYSPDLDSIELAELTVRDPFASALDLCTGTGIQALFAADHCERVVGVDINPRAIHLARLNAALNHVDNVEFRLGDLYEPVSGETFELVTANVPFVIDTATEAHRYRVGGARGDAIHRRILDQLRAHLAEGGVCQIVTHLSQFADGDDQESAVRELARANGCECLVIAGAPFDKLQFAVAQHQELITDYPIYRARIHAFLERLDELGFEEGALAVITLRRTGRARYGRVLALNVPVVHEVDPVAALREFFAVS
jgi:methylase of polypeptide subunit release factors